ncbi:GNAT family N-acetyltransferase [Sphingomonas sp.]|uniref:GNAT family N-acetyltransferase n=1 Tax=Sphingomonas sp. TaxID=28214 RepID=UPI002ED9CDFF
MTVIFRPATPSDAATLAEIGAATFVETFGHLYRPADLAAFLTAHTAENWAEELADARYAVVLGEDAGTPAAYAKLGPAKLPFTPPENAIELRQFYVRAPYHGSGVAAEMMAWAIREARTRGAAAMYLSVFVDNPRARRFYERHGFTRIGRYAFMVGEQADEDDVMMLTL